MIIPELMSDLPGNTKDGAYMAKLWLIQIEKVGPEHISAIVTDGGAAVNPRAAKIVAEK